VVLNDAQIENAIANCLPNKESQRHRLVFELVRELQAIPWLAEADPIELEWIVREWHRRAKPVIRTKDFEESWLDFVEGWEKVKFPKGKEPLAVMWEKAMSQAFPDEVKKYDGDEIKVLARFCRELQLASGESPFFLSVRTAGRLFEVDPTKASRWLQILQLDGIIELVTLGTLASRRASRFLYLGSLDEGAARNTSNGNQTSAPGQEAQDDAS